MARDVAAPVEASPGEPDAMAIVVAERDAALVKLAEATTLIQEAYDRWWWNGRSSNGRSDPVKQTAIRLQTFVFDHERSMARKDKSYPFEVVGGMLIPRRKRGS